MSSEAEHRTEQPPLYWQRPDEFFRKLSLSIRGILRGETNNHFTVTLDPGTDCTEILYPSARPGLSVQITAQNQVAAAFQRANDVWGESTTGMVKVCHDASAAGTERFGVVVVG